MVCCRLNQVQFSKYLLTWLLRECYNIADGGHVVVEAWPGWILNRTVIQCSLGHCSLLTYSYTIGVEFYLFYHFEIS